MPDAQTQFEQAFNRLRLYVQPDVAPVISTSDLRAILTETAKATIWAAETDYNYGDVILPTVRNGHSYTVTVAGTSGETEPTWPAGQSGTVTDGESDPLLVWQEAGPDFANLYNVRQAAHQAWLVKAALVAPLFSTKESGNQYEQQQVYDHCVAQAERFSSIEIA